MKTVSASKLALAIRCLYWLRDDVDWPPDDDTTARIIGTWYHAVCAWMIDVLVGRIKSDEVPKPKEPDCLGDANELTPCQDATALVEQYQRDGVKIRAEVAYVYSPRGVRLVGFDRDRDYGELAADEIPGTADVVIIQPEGRGIVTDWKPNPFRQVDRASDDMQLAFLALCVHLYHGVDEVEVQKHFESEGEGTDDWVDSHTWDAFDLLDVKETVDETIAAIQSNVEKTPRPGMHCTERYCPIRATCPKTAEVVAQLIEPDALGPALAPVEVAANGQQAITSPAHAASLWHRAKAAQVLLDKVTAAVKAYVDANGPVPMEDGRELALVEEVHESIEATEIQAIYEPVSQWVTPEQFAECISVKVPKTALEKKVKAKAERGQKVKAWDAAMQNLRDAGRVRSKTVTKHKIRKVKKEEKAA